MHGKWRHIHRQGIASLPACMQKAAWGRTPCASSAVACRPSWSAAQQALLLQLQRAHKQTLQHPVQDASAVIKDSWQRQAWRSVKAVQAACFT